MKNLSPPSPPFQWWKKSAFWFAREFIIDMGGGGVLFLILFCPRLQSRSKQMKNLSPPSPPFQWWKKSAFWFAREFIIDMGGGGFYFSFYSVQDCSSITNPPWNRPHNRATLIVFSFAKLSAVEHLYANTERSHKTFGERYIVWGDDNSSHNSNYNSTTNNIPFVIEHQWTVHATVRSFLHRLCGNVFQRFYRPLK